jgi:thioredoxin reductase
MTDSESTPDSHELLIIGGGIAGLTAAIFTARASLDTLVVDHGESILRRNAHLENFPGFPMGVNPRLFTDMLQAQATRNGADYQQGLVDDVSGSREDGFVATVSVVDDETNTREIHADRVLIASWSDLSYLDGVGVDSRNAGSKQYVADDGLGRTNVEGVYTAGRIAERYHQAIIAAGDGAETALTLIHDTEIPFYHDWVVPEGYFTDRGREVPPGCEEIDATEQQARQAAARAAMREYFIGPHDERQRTHPSLVDDSKGRIDFEE